MIVPEACVRVRYRETYANCLSGLALTDLKAIYASLPTYDIALGVSSFNLRRAGFTNKMRALIES